MPTVATSAEQHLANGTQSNLPSAAYSQPWWCGYVNNAIPSSGEKTNGSVTSETIQSQCVEEGVGKETDTNSAPQSGSNASNAQETNSHMELVGHSIMLTPYPYPDPQYGGMMSYGAPVHPQFFGFQHARMPLPLDMEEEPVYVNAKQYHGILRRRQSRAKAELEKKVMKSRKPYLHESRHQHAIKRARGSGGRFLNTKKLNEGKDTNTTSEKQTETNGTGTTQSGNSSGSDHLSTNWNGSSEKRTISSGNSHVHGFSSLYYTQSSEQEQGSGDFGQDIWSLRVNRAPHGSTPPN